MLLTIITVWLAVSVVALLGLAMAARHPSHEAQVLSGEGGYPECDHPIMAHTAATSHHHA